MSWCKLWKALQDNADDAVNISSLCNLGCSGLDQQDLALHAHVHVWRFEEGGEVVFEAGGDEGLRRGSEKSYSLVISTVIIKHYIQGYRVISSQIKMQSMPNFEYSLSPLNEVWHTMKLGLLQLPNFGLIPKMEMSHHASNMNKHTKGSLKPRLADFRGLMGPIPRLKKPQADGSEDSEDENPSDDGS
ncbi:hypothetical protein C8J56DRAFT_883302 [Mycena floridula]|nr:hypothetical protein C8J56DRAFT_883302 [Mycena floridula]